MVGHTSRSLITVSTYLQTSAEHEDVATPQEYYARIADYMSTAGADAITERGRQAGRDLGADPVRAIDELVERVLGELGTAGDPLIEVIGGLGIRLHTYLPTRTFELAVHGLDIARATGLSFYAARGCAGRGHVAGRPDRRGNGSRRDAVDVVDGAYRAAAVVLRCLNL